MKNKLLLLCLTLFLVNCKPTKTITEYKEVIKVDTFIRSQIKTIYKAINDTLYLPSPCDSLGNIVPITFTNQKVKYDASKKGILLIITEKQTSDSSIIEKSKSNNTSVQIKYKEVIKYRIPVWAIITIILESLIILLYIYLKVSKFI
jgi:hypothetical protein